MHKIVLRIGAPLVCVLAAAPTVSAADKPQIDTGDTAWLLGVWLAALNEIKTTQLSVRVPDISASLRAVRALQGRPQE